MVTFALVELLIGAPLAMPGELGDGAGAGAAAQPAASGRADRRRGGGQRALTVSEAAGAA